jgi:hypothetical protein
MKNLIAALFVILSILLFSSCTKDCPKINPYFAEVYPQILAGIELECNPDTGSFIFAEINGIDFCHYESQVGPFTLGKTSKFTTASPTFSSGNVESDARHGVNLTLGDNYTHRQEAFTIYFPDFDLGRNFIEYLDSIFAIEDHEVIGAEDVIIPPDADFAEAGLLKFSGGYLKDFLISLITTDRKHGPDQGGIGFAITSISGNQDDSYLRFTKVEKTEDAEKVYYDLEIEFSCNLYHHAQYGYEGLWGEVRNGMIEAHVGVKKG